MSKYDEYLKELEELSTYSESNEFEIDKYLTKTYDYYKNGNFLAIPIIAETCKILYEKLNDKQYLDFALNIFLLGPTNILDLDFADQNNFILKKGEFLAYYTKKVNESYKELALETLNYYANTNSDGRHLKAKAMLEKPSSEDDVLALAVYKNILLEYFSYGNTLDENELKEVGIPSSYLTMSNDELLALIKNNKDNIDELKKIYYVLLNKGNIGYAYDLAKIDNTFILDYYISKRRPFEDYQAIMIGKSYKNSKVSKRFRIIFFIDIIITLIIIFIRNHSLGAIRHLMFMNGLVANIFIVIITLLIPFFLFLFRRSKGLSIAFGVLSLLSATYYFYASFIKLHITANFSIILYIILKIACSIFGFINAKKCKEFNQ